MGIFNQSGEFGIKLTAGLTLRALIWAQDRSKRWNGTDLIDSSVIEIADWSIGMITMVEQLAAGTSGTGRYVGNFPAAITTAGEYEIEFYQGASPTPSQTRFGSQAILWDGNKVSTVATLSAQITELIESMELVINTDALKEALAAITIPNERVVLGPAAEKQDCTRVVIGPARDKKDCSRVVLAPGEEQKECSRVVIGPSRKNSVVGISRNNDGTISIIRQ